ncbi:hypothetical protein ACIRPH_10190 [Nocardiopsis sp. NPDC101807]|uniref:hypothetical protein n=1 Tax=Nocardiopsis sp. NPDC101807 TaxID=3364339 RepID=UPI0037FBF0D8
MSQVPSEVVLKTNRGKAWIILGLVAASSVFATVNMGVELGAGAAWFTGVVCAAIILFGIGQLFLGKTAVTEHELVTRGLFWHRRIPREQAVRVVRVTIKEPSTSAWDSLYVLDARGRRLFYVSDAMSTTAEVDRVVEVLGLPCERLEGQRTFAELARTHGHMMSWVERNQKAMVLIVIGSLFLLCVVIFLVMAVLDALGYV